MEDKLKELGFPLGSRVMMIGEDPCGIVDIGVTGTVCHYTDEWEDDDGCNIGIRIDVKKNAYHDCMGHCDNKHGRYVPHTALALEDCDLGEFDVDTGAIDALYEILV